MLGTFKNPRYSLYHPQIETRILRILYESELVDVRKFKFSDDLRKDQGLDSLNMTALLTSVEHQFTTLFEDRIFESIRNLEEVVLILMRDEKIM